MKKIFYAQSGGVTSVINASACGLIEEARKHSIPVLAGENGIVGALRENLIDVSQESDETIAALRYTPAGAFGSCRYKLKSLDQNKAEYERLIEVFSAHDIGYFFYNGGNDSQDTAYKVSCMSEKMGYPLTCIGIPKTIDNDLPFIDSCPGFGSVAKYVATSIMEASYDVASMCESSTKVFVFEVMGRHAGWIAAAGGLAALSESDGPHVILFPEIAFNEEKFLAKVQDCVEKYGYCSVIVSEGVKREDGKFLSDTGRVDAFGHTQLGGAAQVIATLVSDKLKLKYHYAIADYLQRSARHIASKNDVDQAYALGQAALRYALEGKTNIMPIIERISDSPYRWQLNYVKLEDVANVEKKLPRDFISEDGFHITEKCRAYLLPLISGEDYPEFQDGLPKYAKIKGILVPKKLPSFVVNGK